MTSLGEPLIILCVISLTIGITSWTSAARRTRSASRRIHSTQKVLEALSASSPEVDVLLMAMRADAIRIALASRTRRFSTVALPLLVSSVGALGSALVFTASSSASLVFVPSELAPLVISVVYLFVWAGVAMTWMAWQEVSIGEGATRRLMSMAADDPKAAAADRWKEGNVPSWFEEGAYREDDC